MRLRLKASTRAIVGTLLAMMLLVALPFAGVVSAETIVSGDFANVRAGPSTNAAIVGTLVPGDAFEAVGTVSGEEVVAGNDAWYQSSFGNYVYTGAVTPSGSAATSARGAGGGAGRSIDVNLSTLTASAIENGQVVYTAPVTSGRPGFDTPIGNFTIVRRVANETMDAATLGVPPGSPGYYHLEGVLYTQYFTDFGHALHYNYWSPASAFGNSRESRGCVGLTLSDAAFFWDFAGVGTPVSIHH